MLLMYCTHIYLYLYVDKIMIDFFPPLSWAYNGHDHSWKWYPNKKNLESARPFARLFGWDLGDGVFLNYTW